MVVWLRCKLSPASSQGASRCILFWDLFNKTNLYNVSLLGVYSLLIVVLSQHS